MSSKNFDDMEKTSIFYYYTMVRPGYCTNCGVPSLEVLCEGCKDYRRCTRYYRHLPDRSYPAANDNVCAACQRRNPDNVGRYCLERLIGDRTWRGAARDIDVGDFVQQHENDITITFETARNENDAIKYYFEMEVEFYCVGPEDTDVQHTTARFYILLMTSDVNDLNLADIVSQFNEKIDGFSGQGSGWIVCQINDKLFATPLGQLSSVDGRYVYSYAKVDCVKASHSERTVF